MKILCVIDSLGSGGAQRQLTGLAIMLKEKGFNVQLVTWVHRKNDLFFVQELAKNGVDYLYSAKLQNRYKRLHGVYKLIKQLKPDVVISYYPGISTLFCIYRFVFGKSFKLIVSERSLTSKLNFKTKLKYFLYQLSDFVVPNAEMEADFIKNKFPSLRTKVRSISNFVDQSRFYSIQKTINDYEKIKAIFVGRFTEAKNIPGLLRAIKLVIDAGYVFEIDFYGHSHQKQYSEQCLSLSKSLNITSYVHFHPQIENIEDRYKDHNLLILPSLWEGYPNVLCEAMSCGLPVLCSKISDIPIIMEDGINGYLFDPENIEDISLKIIKYLKLSTTEKKRMGDKSSEITKNKFSRETFIEQYLQLIK